MYMNICMFEMSHSVLKIGRGLGPQSLCLHCRPYGYYLILTRSPRKKNLPNLTREYLY